MKLGIMTYSMSPVIRSGQMTLVEAMRFARGLGIKGIDFLAALYEGPAAEMCNTMRDLDLEPAIYTFTGADFCLAKAAERQPAVDRVMAALDRAREMGFERVMVTTGAIKDGMSRADSARCVGEGLRPCAERAASMGMRLAIEDFPGPRSPHATAAECLAVCEAAGPHLRLVFDTGNAFTWNEDPVDTWNAMKAKVIHAHLKDWTCADFDKPPRGIKGKDYKPALVGQGLLPYPRLLAAMKASGFTGCLAFEYEGKEDRIEMARQGIRYLQEMLAALP